LERYLYRRKCCTFVNISSTLSQLPMQLLFSFYLGLTTVIPIAVLPFVQDTQKPTLPPTTSAQPRAVCASILPFVAGRSTTFALFDGEGRNTGRMIYQYDKAVEGSYRVDKYDAYNHLRRTANGKIDCSPSVSSLDWTPKILDLLGTYQGKETIIGENQLAYPAQLTVGDALPDGALSVRIADRGRTLVDVNMRATERRVEAVEPIRAAGNNYDAYRITYLQTVVTTTNNQAGVPIKYRQTEWVVPNVGLVKTATADAATGKPIASSVLSSQYNEAQPIAVPTDTAPATTPSTLTPSEPSSPNVLDLPTDLPSIVPN
jgi:hypothetical protein